MVFSGDVGYGPYSGAKKRVGRLWTVFGGERPCLATNDRVRGLMAVFGG